MKEIVNPDRKEEKKSELLTAVKYFGLKRGFNDLVFIDATWKQSRQIARDERILKMQRLQITSHSTLFWRYQQFGEEFLATIEAIYYTLKEYTACIKGEYNGEVDDLLFYYVYFYNMIQDKYDRTGQEFHRKKNWKRQKVEGEDGKQFLEEDEDE